MPGKVEQLPAEEKELEGGRLEVKPELQADQRPYSEDYE